MKQIKRKLHTFICSLILRYLTRYLQHTAWDCQQKADVLKSLAVLEPDQIEQLHYNKGQVHAYATLLQYLENPYQE